MAKVYCVQLEILLTADEKALLEHCVKEHNQKYKNSEQPETGGRWRRCCSVYCPMQFTRR